MEEWSSAYALTRKSSFILPLLGTPAPGLVDDNLTSPLSIPLTLPPGRASIRHYPLDARTLPRVSGGCMGERECTGLTMDFFKASNSALRVFKEVIFTAPPLTRGAP